MSWVLFAQIVVLVILVALLIGAIVTNAIRAWREIN